MINVRQKGAEGEREVARALNSIVKSVLKARGIPVPVDLRSGKEIDIIQRNQNQSAVGGSDLTNPFGIAFEVKRHEMLSINTWWTQCTNSAQRAMELPVLVFRQNGKREWRVIMMGSIPVFAPSGYNEKTIRTRCEIGWQDFLQWFYHWVDSKILFGLEVKA